MTITTVILLTEDGHRITTPFEVISVSDKIVTLLKECEPETTSKGLQCTISVPEVSGDILERVVTYCRVRDDPDSGDAFERHTVMSYWDEKFMDVDIKTLHELIVASRKLNVEGLYSLCCAKIVKMLEGRDLEATLFPERTANPEEFLNDQWRQ